MSDLMIYERRHYILYRRPSGEQGWSIHWDHDEVQSEIDIYKRNGWGIVAIITADVAETTEVRFFDTKNIGPYDGNLTNDK